MMLKKGAKETFYARWNVYLTKDDCDYIESLRKQQNVSRTQAIRMLLILGRHNLESLTDGGKILFLK